MKVTLFLIASLISCQCFLYGNSSKSQVFFKRQESSFIIPFRLVSKLIIVEATVNDKRGFFILDTGLPDLVLNKVYFHKDKSLFNFHGITHKNIPASKVITNFQLETIEYKNRTVISLDLRHLERKTKLPILGMIGYAIFKKMELLFDYENKIITAFLLNKKGEKIAKASNLDKPPVDTIAFKYKGHLVTIPIECQQNKFRFGLDTGAGINLIAEKYTLLLTEDNRANVTVKILNMHKNKKVIINRKIMEYIKINNNFLRPMKTIPYNLGEINANLAGKRIDGILGYEFFAQQKISINFRQKKLYLWPKSTTKQHKFATNY